MPKTFLHSTKFVVAGEHHRGHTVMDAVSTRPRSRDYRQLTARDGFNIRRAAAIIIKNKTLVMMIGKESIKTNLHIDL